MKIYSKDKIFFLNKLIAKKHLRSDDYNFEGYNDVPYVDEIFIEIKDLFPNQTTFTPRKPISGYCSQIRINEGGESELIQFLKEDGFGKIERLEKQKIEKEQYDYTLARRNVKFWLDPRWYFGLLTGSVTTLVIKSIWDYFTNA